MGSNDTEFNAIRWATRALQWERRLRELEVTPTRSGGCASTMSDSPTVLDSSVRRGWLRPLFGRLRRQSKSAGCRRGVGVGHAESPYPAPVDPSAAVTRACR
jgi:hypothetical protein